MTLCPQPAEELAPAVEGIDPAHLLEPLLDTLPDFVAIKDVEGRFVCVSRSFVARLGCTDPSEVLGKSDFDFLSDEHARKAYREESEIMRTGEGLLGNEERETAPDGRETWISTTKLPLHGRDGIVIGVLSISSDITAKKQAAETFAEQAAELARLNGELEQFAHMASYDLQEPLRLIASHMELLGKRYADQLEGDGNAYVAYTLDGVNRMHGLIADLLAYSRAGQAPELAPVPMAEVVDRALARLETAISDADAVVERGELPVVRGDARLLGQVFESLIENAVKFRSEQPPQIRIGAELGRLGWTFSVADNGVGIEPELRDSVFAVFQRARPSATRLSATPCAERDDNTGNGIGLSICKKIVERHGGVIWFDSTPGEGTVFRFVLPSRKTS